MVDPNEPYRQVLVGAAILADLEAELLGGDDAYLRDELNELAWLVRDLALARDTAVSIHVQLADEHDRKYEPADLDAALADYRNARALLLAKVRDIADYTTLEEAP